MDVYLHLRTYLSTS